MPHGFRPYRPSDRAACLRLFDSNCPQYFDPSERADFAYFLDDLAATAAPDQPADAPETAEGAAAPSQVRYLVLEGATGLLACGGLETASDGQKAWLAWGMVDRDSHQQRLGSHLTEARLALARRLPGLREVHLATSQLVHGFYARFGFELREITPQGFGPDLDRYDMVLPLEARAGQSNAAG